MPEIRMNSLKSLTMNCGPLSDDPGPRFRVKFPEEPLEGYRRLTFMMLDADIVAVSPTSVWRVSGQAGLTVLEEFLLPSVEDRWLESHFIAQLRDGLLLQQVPSQDGDLLLRRVLLPLLLHAFSPLS